MRHVLQLGGSIATCVLVMCIFACTRALLGPGTHTIKFVWHDGLQSLETTSNALAPHDLGADFRRELQPIIRDRMTRANLSSAEGTITLSILGTDPLLINVIDFKIDSPPFSDLLRAVESNNAKEIKTLVDKYHNANQRDLPSGRTALFYAAEESHAMTLQVLLSLGASPNISDFEGDTPLMAAVTGSSPTIVKDLISSGANPSQADGKGFTPIMRAVQLNQHDILLLLLHSGADPNAKSSEGKSAMRIAEEVGDKDAISLLRRFGATN